jgi:RNA polymerase sigma-70 factor (ECF subfamily)
MPTTAEQITGQLPALRRFARSLTRDEIRAEDLVQDCVARALERVDQFEPGTSLAAWLITIMRSIFYNQCRRAVLEKKYLQQISLEPLSYQRPNQALRLELRETLDAMRLLSDEHQQALRLVGIDEHSHAEAAAEMGVAVGTAKTRLHRAREQLRAQLEV